MSKQSEQPRRGDVMQVRDSSLAREPRTLEQKKSPLLNPEQKRLRDMIHSISQCMGIDPELTSCLAHQESKFDGRAKSSTGAIGCMQVLTGSQSPAMDIAIRNRPYSEAIKRLPESIINSVVDTRARGILLEMKSGKFTQYGNDLKRRAGEILNQTLRKNDDDLLNIIVGCAYQAGMRNLQDMKKTLDGDKGKLGNMNKDEIRITQSLIENSIINGIPRSAQEPNLKERINKASIALIEEISEQNGRLQESITQKSFDALVRYNRDGSFDRIKTHGKNEISPIPHRVIYALTILTKEKIQLLSE